MTKNDIITLRIDGYSSTGDGVAHHDGRAIFVRRALVGETVSARILKATNTAVFAKIEELIDASPERVQPDCVHFGKCGGCALQHMSYDEELRLKHSRVSDALRRIGGVEAALPPVIPAPAISRYRNKAIFEVGMQNGVPVTGFYRERSHDIVAVQDCLIQSESANLATMAVREWMSACKIPDGLIRYVFCRTSADGKSQIVIVARRKNVPNTRALTGILKKRIPLLSGVSLCINNSPGNVVITGGLQTIYGDEQLADTLCGNTFLLSPHSFYQINRDVAVRLYERAVSFAALKKTETAVELYCGAGTITLALARHAGFVYGAEIVAESVKNAKENAVQNGVSNVEFILGDAGEAAETLAKSGIAPAVAVVDPPRKGLSRDVIGALLKMSPERIIYVSCDPATLARDIKLLSGYGVSELCAFDMFPRTSHVETVVLLSRKIPNDVIHIDLELDEMDITAAEAKATYQEIKDYVLDKFGFKVSQLYIAQVKRKHGIIERENYNTGEGKAKVPQVPADKEKAIEDALRHFEMV